MIIRNRYLLLFVIGFALLASGLNAATTNFKLKIPPKWQEMKQLWGLDYSLVGPKKEQHGRPVITVTKAAHSKFPMEFFTKGEYFSSYQKSKSKWLQDAKGALIRFGHDPAPKMKHIKKAYMTEVSYLVNSEGYLERSYYLPCSDHLYLVKYLLPLAVKGEFFQQMEQSVRGFKCGG
ncbi:MAG: hypothetical protein HN353_00135 [Bdellovibrionales bacterium]|jgi:hypothetical protein|nr:hypothetical protein [Bdellovibrionales bacterium]MBT3525777.1 hypothetical protein [Bdellovibrionales bacterium]MBT7767830.1 hypothetical protein [Bdellovibrionales bacterium]